MFFKKYKLKDLGEIVTGKTPKKSNKEYYNSNDIMFIKPDDLFQDNILLLNNSKEYISKKGAETVRVLPKNSVLVTCIGTIGKVAILNSDEAAFNQQINAIIPNEKIIISKFLAYSIWFNRRKLQAVANAPVVPIINKTQFSEFEIQVPNIDYQKKVVNILDKASDLINKRKAQIEALDQLTQSVFLEMFGDPVRNSLKWDMVRLGQLGEWKSGGTPSRSNKEYFKGKIPWLSAGELNSIFTYSSNEYITEEALENSAAKLIEKDSLLLGMYDTAALKATINKVECSCNQAVAFAKLDESIVDTIFVYYCIQIGKNYYKRLQRGVRQKNMNLTMIKNIQIICPNVELQRKFANVVENILEQKGKLVKGLIELENNYNSLIQRTFKGELFTEEKASNF
ncbi:restriction endonuclease subunit S [Aeribacillus alveayuensis]|uniref:Type I restriction enzyme S subunit n=1 Tax=Aeribacillus alveayuensis TaxID=279215 RepID=A0ABT9VRE7_9BACI|nr:type I restriction enzyme S subunit [Bacillus alveayuensis]